MSTRIILGVKTAPSSADVTESGSLNFPEPSGPHRPVMGMLYLYYYYYYYYYYVALQSSTDFWLVHGLLPISSIF
jgi:hypothetical protein